MMRQIMEGYIRQIDSLNTINKKLVGENSSIRKKLLDYRLRAESAEEKSEELSTKVRQGAVIRARDIRLVALNKSDREVSRANRAESLRVDLVLVGNELATPGERNVYVQIIGPDGFVMANQSNAMFDYEGDQIVYSATRSVDYQNQDLSVSIFYYGAGITSGTYRVKNQPEISRGKARPENIEEKDAHLSVLFCLVKQRVNSVDLRMTILETSQRQWCVRSSE